MLSVLLEAKSSNTAQLAGLLASFVAVLSSALLFVSSALVLCEGGLSAKPHAERDDEGLLGPEGLGGSGSEGLAGIGSPADSRLVCLGGVAPSSTGESHSSC